MKKNDPEEVHQMRETLHQFAKVARTVSAVQGKLRESFAPPPLTAGEALPRRPILT